MLQRAIDNVHKWCIENDMILSAPKCAVLCLKNRHSYLLDGNVLPIVNSIRDLGVTMTPELDFGLHITNTIQAASLICNMIFRSFILKRPAFYLSLYKSLVIPKFLYCCETWRPYLKKHLEAIERVQSKFIRRVSLRCNVERNTVELSSISQLHTESDQRMYNRILRTNTLSHYLIARQNNLRSTQTVTALEVARTERVNNVFSWRIARQLRSQ